MKEHENRQFLKAVNMSNATKKIFISHKEQNKLYGQFIVDVLERYRIDVSTKIIFTDNRRLGVPQGRDIYDYLKECFREDLLVIFIFSKAFYDSNICISEVGASWATNKNYLTVVTDIGFDDIERPANSAQISIKFKDIRDNDQRITLSGFFSTILQNININHIDEDRLKESIEFILEQEKYSDNNINNPAVFCPIRKFLPIPTCCKCGNRMKLKIIDGKVYYSCTNVSCDNKIDVNFE